MPKSQTHDVQTVTFWHFMQNSKILLHFIFSIIPIRINHRQECHDEDNREKNDKRKEHGGRNHQNAADNPDGAGEAVGAVPVFRAV